VSYTQEDIDKLLALLKNANIEATAGRGNHAAQWRVNGVATDKDEAIKILEAAMAEGIIPSFTVD